MAPNREVSMSTSLLYHAFGIRGYEYVPGPPHLKFNN
jgi:hypothetical protein